MRCLLAFALAISGALWAGVARAQDDAVPLEDDLAAFPLIVTHDKHYVRAGLEVGGILVVGYVDYLLNTAARGGELRPGDDRWELRYAWADLRGKLVGHAYELDGNRFGTNYLSHPFAGTLYYEASRSNHLSLSESFLFSVVGSTTWEFFGEMREKVSVNDMIVTPVAGMAIGEAMMQLSGFFDRGKRNVPNGALSFLLSPVKAINYWTEGAEPLRADATDALGLPVGPWHRFEARAGAATTWQRGESYGDVRFALDTKLANLPSYADQSSRERSHARLFDDANVSSVAFEGAVSRGELVDAVFTTRVLPFGFYHRDVGGQRAVLGLRIGFEYGVHDYDRQRERPRDLVALVSPLGIGAEYTVERGSFRLRSSLDVQGSIAGVRPYALGYGTRGGSASLVSDGYYHAVSVTAEPRVTVGLSNVEVAARMRIDAFRAIEDRDTTDRRIGFGASLAWEPPRTPLRVELGAEQRTRVGDHDGVHASRTERSVYGTLGLVF